MIKKIKVRTDNDCADCILFYDCMMNNPSLSPEQNTNCKDFKRDGRSQKTKFKNWDKKTKANK